MNLVNSNSPILKAECSLVPQGSDTSAIVTGMYGVMQEGNGVGIAAPQVGHAVRIIIIRYGAVDMAIINPAVTPCKGTKRVTSKEGCLSFPGRQVKVKRHKRVTLTGYDVDWQPVTIELNKFLSFIAQHEVDHLNGVTIA